MKPHGLRVFGCDRRKYSASNKMCSWRNPATGKTLPKITNSIFKLVFQNFALPCRIPGLHLYGFVIEYYRLTMYVTFQFDISIGLYSTQFYFNFTSYSWQKICIHFLHFMLLQGDCIHSLQCVLFTII